MFLISLVYGIKIDNISYNNIYLNELYLKYDKKLILTLNKLQIETTNDNFKNKFDSLDIVITRKILGYFTEIKIETLSYDNKNIFFEYKNNTLNLIYKDFNKSTKNENKIKLTAKIKDNKLYYKVFSNKIDDIQFLKKFYKLDTKAETLLYKQLSFDHIKLDSFFGYIDLKNINDFNFNSIYSSFSIEKAKVKLPNNNTFFLDNIIVSLKDKKLNIKVKKDNNLDHLTFDGNIDVNIKNLDNLDLNVLGNLIYKNVKIDTKINVVKDILDYSISSNHIKDIRVFDKFISYSDELRIWIVDRLKIDNIKINNAKGKIFLKDFFVDFTTLRVDATINNPILDFNPRKAFPVKAKEVTLLFNGKDILLKFIEPFTNDIKLDVQEAIIYDIFKDTGISLKINSSTPLNSTIDRLIKSYNIELPANLNINQTKGKSKINVNINIPFDEKPIKIFVNIQNKNSTFLINEKHINFKTIEFIYKNNKVYIKDLNTIYNGFEIDTSNIVFDLKTKIAQFDLDLTKYEIYNKKDKLNTIKLFIDLNKNSNITIEDKIGLIKTNILINNEIKTNIKLNNIDIKYNNRKQKCQNIIFDLPNINFDLSNGSILYNDKLIIYDNLDLKIKNEKIDITLNKNNSIIDILVDNKNLELNAKNLDINFLNNIFGLDIFKQGIINIKVKGSQCLFKGDMKVKDLILKEYKIENANASISLNRDTKILTLSSIDAKSDEYYINGDTLINLDENKINSKLHINFMKNYSNIMSYIPLVGYILLGDDDKITYDLNIDGDLKNPKISTKILEETSLVPLNIIKRIITLPLKPFENNNQK